MSVETAHAESYVLVVLLGADASVLQSSFFTDQGYLVGTRDRDDLSDARPLGIDDPAPARW